ncbi:MAG TPA: DUF1549 domain-containing protein [Pirellulales bacterium]|jgi:hypothetical protein|nr:DUF1549 domain-containing protein [Pirellulales bacterium]
MVNRRWLAAVAIGVLGLAGRGYAAGLDPHAAAKHVDELLFTELFGGSENQPAAAMPRSDDQTFLRRAGLDLTGHPPTAEDVTAFSLDGAADKRDRAIERLLAEPRFGENWARYWRDVIFFRRSEERALIASASTVKFLTQAFNNDPHWDKIAHKFITAKGDVRVEGATAVIMSQAGVPEDTTAEISRIFLGIQIQCAQCHNHPTDRWKREQFHELAAFFPRIALRPLKDGEQRSFEIVAVDRLRKKDADKPAKPKRGKLEHHMPDLKHPEQEGKLMQPVFFVTGQKLDVGVPDARRREMLAEWITAGGDRWFAKAFVNRMWSELVGHGFYEPVDDIGPDRNCSAPHTLDYLAEHFATNGYDIKWLFRVVTLTEAYQRQSRSRYEEGEAPFAASCPQRLRGDQLYNSLAEFLEIDETVVPQAKKRPYEMLAGPRGQMNVTFGYDPSTRRDEIAGSIPQALLLMNGPAINRAINGRAPATSLGRLLVQNTDDRAVVEELYLRALGREATSEETATCLDHVASLGNRNEAFEDIQWALINSTEFLNRK